MSVQRLSDEMAARGCPLSRTAIARRENGYCATVTVDELFAMAAVLGKSVEELAAELVGCKRCEDDPPAGFTCGLCGRAGVHPEHQNQGDKG
jgi:transcriptional regulator with XRE-family HTH domain